MKFLHYVLALILLVSVPAVTAAPIENITDAPIGHELNIEQIKKAVLLAGSGRGWQMKETTDGQIEAVLNIRKHQAIVRIDYNLHSYSITYVDSTNLKAKNGQIHKNYNNWVNNLNNDIKKYLQQYAYAG
ncbi:hypothetical protein [Rheinheimera sp. NSM]|uniref:hypothetical protein n=1 Tax=Rheinheimera sp. NSM TaxID=3457884 RepID=UPI0040354CE5